MTFFLLRQVCLGYHFKNFYTCLFWSVIAFPVAAKYLATLKINFHVTYLYIIGIILFLLVFKLAPKGTKNQPIINSRHRNYLRKKMTIRLLVLIGVFCLSPLKIKIFITYGIFLESTMLIVQTLKERITHE